MQITGPSSGVRVGETESEREAILRQLEQILAHPLFKNSKRYPTLLRHVVEQRLEGASQLKERTLGVEVFGRPAEYDTNIDPVVRTTAGEIRKRIAQFYAETGDEYEVRIELPSGSYLPEFHFREIKSEVAAPTEAPPAVEAAPATPSVRTRRIGLRWIATAAIPALVVAALWLKPWIRPTALDEFWTPVLSSSHPVLLCVGQRAQLNVSTDVPPDVDPSVAWSAQKYPEPAKASLYQLYLMGFQNVALHDVVAVTRMTGLLQAKGQEFHVRGELSTSFGDLREGPVVLIGAFNNDWTLRLTGSLRYTFRRQGADFGIGDQKNPALRSWRVNYATPYLTLTEDYALISRVQDPTTGRMVVVVAGLTGFGTMASGELLTNPDLFRQVQEQAPTGWERRNLQIVVSTKVFGGNSGPPRVLAVYSW